MIWLNFLHFYQPANQQPDILSAVASQCYIPIFNKISTLNNVGITMNITGSLLELFEKHGYSSLIDQLDGAIKSGKVELTGSCKYHALLPLIPEEEVIRQITQNEETLRKYFGKDLKLRGFFPPEMAYDSKLSPLLSKLGYEWVIVDEIANPEGFVSGATSNLYVSEDTNLKVFFRVRRASNLIMSAVVRNRDSFKEALGSELSHPGYLLTGMDGETFGHHRIGFEKFLFDTLEDSEIERQTMSQYLDSNADNGEKIRIITPMASTWASSPQDIKDGIQFISWKDRGNELHGYQWDLLQLALDQVKNENTNPNDPAFMKAREEMDAALASDHFFWASGNPWWGLEMIEDGAFRLLSVIRLVPGVGKDTLDKASKLYEKIISTAFAWQRTGKIRKMAIEHNEFLRVPFKDRTLGRGGEESAVYQAFIDLLKRQEKKAVEKGEYEKAILWRDSLYKLDNKLDIFDAVNAIDLLRIDIGNEEVERMIEKYKQDYLNIRGGQPEQRSH